VISAMPIRLSQNPARAIWAMRMRSEPNTTAFGGVATGSMKAQLAAIAAGTIRASVSTPSAGARPARIGMKVAAVAVLLFFLRP